MTSGSHTLHSTQRLYSNNRHFDAYNRGTNYPDYHPGQQSSDLMMTQMRSFRIPHTPK